MRQHGVLLMKRRPSEEGLANARVGNASIVTRLRTHLLEYCKYLLTRGVPNTIMVQNIFERGFQRLDPVGLPNAPRMDS